MGPREARKPSAAKLPARGRMVSASTTAGRRFLPVRMPGRHIVFGLLLFISPVKLPGVVYSAVELMSDMNTPLAMLILGSYLAQIDLKQMFCDKAVWKTAALRILLIPAAALVILMFLPVADMAKLVLMVAVATPSGITCAMFAQMYDSDYLFATRVVGLTTLLSLVLLPMWIAAMTMVL